MRACSRWLLRCVPILLAITVCILPAEAVPLPLGSFTGSTPTLPDPLPIRRMLLPPDRAEAALAASGREQFLKMPRREFESHVQHAARRQAADRLPPQIVEATYQAEWFPGRMTGRGQWRIKNPGSLPGAVLVEPLTPAIHDAAWADGASALLFRGVLPGRPGSNTWLWNATDAGGELRFDWSLRGLDEADEEKFDIAFPPSPIASFEFVLPTDRTPTILNGTGLLQGPFPAARADRRTWTIRGGSANRFELSIRKPGAGDTNSPAVLSRTSRWLLSGTSRTGTIETTIESPRGTPLERRFVADPDLIVHDVSGPGVESWKSQGAEIVVRTRDIPGPAKWTFTVSTTSTTGPTGWQCPTLRLTDSLPGSETVEIQCAPDVKVEHWSPGDFRVAATSANQTTKLTFTGTLLAGTGEDRKDRKMPVVRYKTSEYEFTTREVLDWRLEPGRNTLSATIQVRVIRGPLASLGLQLPPGYVPTNITATPDDPGLTWVALLGVPNTWTLEPTRAIPGGSEIGLRVEARGTQYPHAGHPGDLQPGAVVLPFPKVRPIGAADRHLAFTASAAAGLTARFVSSAAGTEQRENSFRGEFHQRDADGEAVVTPIPPQAEVEQTVALTLLELGKVHIRSTFHGRIEQGLASGVLVLVPGEAEPVAEWAGRPVKPRRASLPGWGNRLLVPGPGLDLSVVGSTGQASLWFLPFPRPSSGEFTFAIEYPWTIPSGDSPLALPLPNLCGARLGERRVTLDAALAEQFVPPPSGIADVLLLQSRRGSSPPEPVRRAGWTFSDVRLRNRIDDDGRTHCTLTGRVVEAGGTILPIQREGGFGTLESAAVDSHEVSLPFSASRNEVRLPIREAGASFELRYTMDRDSMPRLAGTPPLELPQIPGLERYEIEWQTDGEYLFGLRLGTTPTEGDRTVWVVRGSALQAFGYAVAAVWLVCGWYAWLRPRRRAFETVCFGLLMALGWLSRFESAGGSLVLRPLLLAGVVVVVGNILRAGVGFPRRGTAAIAIGWITMAQAQVIEPVIVYLVPGEGDDSVWVFAPKTLLTKLDALAKAPLPSAVMTRAEYTVRPSDDAAIVDATFQIDSAGSRDSSYDIPLTGVRLERALLDGQPAFLDGSKGDRFTVALHGQGPHTLEFRFAVPVAVAGSDRDVRFGIPEVPSTRVTLETGPKTRQLDVPTRRGGQSLTRRESGSRLVADHGGGKNVQLRWRDDSVSDGVKPSLAIREAIMWDLGESASACTSAFLYRIQGGTLSQLRFECPEGLAPVRVDVRTQEAKPQPLGIKSWSVGKPAGGWCPVDVRLQNPTDGRLTLVVQLRPTRPLAARSTLRMPRCSDAPDAERDTMFGFRFSGTHPDQLTATSSVEIPTDSLLKDFSGIAELNLDKLPPARVYRRTGNASPEAKLILSPPSPWKADGMEVEYRLGRRAEAAGRCRATVQDGAVLEFDLPAAFRLFDLDGPQLGGWWRSGNRVAVWFRSGQPAGLVEVTFNGSIGNDVTAGDGETDLPVPRWPVAISPARPTELEVRVAEGFRARVVSSAGWKPVPEYPPAPDRWTFVAETAVSATRFAVQPEGEPAKPSQAGKSLANTSVQQNSSASPMPGPVNEPPSPRMESQTRVVPWVGALAWLCGIALVARWPARRWPERVTLLGLLAAAALGFTTTAGLPMLGLALFGIAAGVRRLIT